MLQTLRKYKAFKIVFLLFLTFTIWWLYIQLFSDPESEMYNIFSDTYGLLAGLGGILGLTFYKKWGGSSSYMGKAILFFSLGLIAQWFGQLVYSFYFLFLKIDVPYPSLGDLGYFGSIPLYVLGVWYIAKASGVFFAFKKGNIGLILLSVFLPVFMLIFSYSLFLTDYELDFSAPLTLFLDLGYPLGQSLYVSFALLTFVLSKGFLGGIMKPKILLLLFALFMQYVSDFMFLYLNSRELWTAGGVNDYMYLVSYFVMVLSLFKLNEVFDDIKNGGQKNG